MWGPTRVRRDRHERPLAAQRERCGGCPDGRSGAVIVLATLRVASIYEGPWAYAVLANPKHIEEMDLGSGIWEQCPEAEGLMVASEALRGDEVWKLGSGAWPSAPGKRTSLC